MLIESSTIGHAVWGQEQEINRVKTKRIVFHFDVVSTCRLIRRSRPMAYFLACVFERQIATQLIVTGKEECGASCSEYSWLCLWVMMKRTRLLWERKMKVEQDWRKTSWILRFLWMQWSSCQKTYVKWVRNHLGWWMDILEKRTTSWRWTRIHPHRYRCV